VTVDPPSGPGAVTITERSDDADGINGSTGFGNTVDFISGGGPAIELTFVALTDAGDPILSGNGPSGPLSILYSNDPSLGPTVNLTSGPTIFLYCFASDTQISTDRGDIAVQSLAIGDTVVTAEGRSTLVKWIGRQTVSTRFGPAERLMPVRFAAGSLGDGLPATDLTVTADHGMLVDGVICHAGALVNAETITRVPLADMGDTYTVYHIETENHEIILANGAPAETFIDNVSRRVFDNFAEFEALYGDVPEMEELPYPRAMSARQVPAPTRYRLAMGKVA
jgi:hypothetical protein